MANAHYGPNVTENILSAVRLESIWWIKISNFNLQGDLILEVGHIIEAVTKIADVTKKPQSIKVVQAGR